MLEEKCNIEDNNNFMIVNNEENKFQNNDYINNENNNHNNFLIINNQEQQEKEEKEEEDEEKEGIEEVEGEDKKISKWTIQDDLLLKESIQNYTSIKKIARGVKFSNKFTPKEIEERWKYLLYDSKQTSMETSKIMNISKPLTKRILWTKTEEEILKKEANNNSFTNFQNLLEKNRSKFHPSRTPKMLESHYYRMKKSLGEEINKTNQTNSNVTENITNDDNNQIISKGENFNSIDEKLTQSSQQEGHIYDEITIKLKKQEYLKKEQIQQENILKIENDFRKENDIEKNENALAILRGFKLRYIMTTKEIILGRATINNLVDVNLAEEGPAHKISRKQAIIKIKSNGEFYIKNIGKITIFINGKPVEYFRKRKLTDHCLIEIDQLRFIFEIHKKLWEKIKQLLQQ